ncbi:MAG: DUF1501 domain-containing protein [Betaproteobacteria bacterium]|nr:DUF1501 domain-containing protein [Betaproteobacteria bacterium]
MYKGPILHRRNILKSALAGSALFVGDPTGYLGAAATGQTASGGADEYRVLVVVFLSGGYDGNDTLLHLDAGFNDYQAVRMSLALKKDSVLPIRNGATGQRIGINPALAPLQTLYEERRLAWVANVGALIQPVTAEQVKSRSVPLPPFLMSHSEQVDIVQGWDPVDLPSGWVGRGMELLGVSPQTSLPIISFARDNTIVTGLRSAFARADSSGGDRNWLGDITDRSNSWMKQVRYMANMQPSNQVEAEYLRAMSSSLSNSEIIANAAIRQSTNRVSFPENALARDLSFSARLMSHFKSEGARRQIYFTTYGQFDTHSQQRGGYGASGLEDQFSEVAGAIKAFDNELKARQLDRHVVTLVMTEFGRTLMPAGSGTDHAWGVPWFLLGTPVLGGQVLGQVPPPVIGSDFDFDKDRKGRWVPEYSSDQIGATVMSWMGVSDAKLLSMSPNLRNFPSAKLPLL